MVRDGELFITLTKRSMGPSGTDCSVSLYVAPETARKSEECLSKISVLGEPVRKHKRRELKSYLAVTFSVDSKARPLFKVSAAGGTESLRRTRKQGQTTA